LHSWQKYSQEDCSVISYGVLKTAAINIMALQAISSNLHQNIDLIFKHFIEIDPGFREAKISMIF
jgi:hypothetical protein